MDAAGADLASLERSGGFYSVAGRSLEYQWLGSGPDAALTLVLLHEGLGCVGLWKDFPTRLAQASGCGVLVYSRLGYGASDPAELPRPLSYMHDEALQTLPEVLDRARIRRAVLVGHSDGASIALIHAGGLVDPRILGLVLMAPHVFVEPLTLATIFNSKALFDEGTLREQLRRYHGDNVDGAFWGWNRAWLDPGFLQWNIEFYLAQISLPVLLLQGLDDEYGTDRQLQALESQLAGPVQTHRLAHCGHSPFRDQAHLSAQAIINFIQQFR